MNNSKLEQLLDKYFAGETSLQEEKQLKSYFSYGDVHPDFKEYAPLFRFFEDAGDEQLPENFDEKLMARINSPIEMPQRTAKRFNLNIKYLSRIAAALLFILAAYYFYEAPQKTGKELASKPIDWSKYEVKTAEEAYSATLMALTKTSYEMNVGAGTVAKEMNKTRIHWKQILK
ncbi:MAG: hypothetical protein KDC85_23720 [Saprospiraceae bacterium]|nr:hypothetical protein [Saprospiraceae bacterium]MCB9322225.1 hypothetical protein [Lewinellaceae bacterium]